MATGNFYDRLGDLLKDGLESDEDPFVAWDSHGGKTRSAGGMKERRPPPRPKPEEDTVRVPDELLEDYFALGLRPGVSAEAAKAAWKRLLKLHHPDRFANRPDKAEEATKRSIRITDSYRRIVRWFETGKLD